MICYFWVLVEDGNDPHRLRGVVSVIRRPSREFNLSADSLLLLFNTLIRREGIERYKGNELTRK